MEPVHRRLLALLACFGLVPPLPPRDVVLQVHLDGEQHARTARPLLRTCTNPGTKRGSIDFALVLPIYFRKLLRETSGEARPCLKPSLQLAAVHTYRNKDGLKANQNIILKYL